LTPDQLRLSKQLCKRLNYSFNNEALLTEALSHRSAGAQNYERLEFLGDSALGFVIATTLFERRPELDEGSLSRLRASLVNGVTLSEIARELELGQYLNLGTGELKSGGFDRASILADVVESIIGAIYLDAGFTACQEFILALFHSRLESLPSPGDLKDAKTRLQEFLQGKGLDLPLYALVEATGKSHEREFTVSCEVESFAQRVQAQGSSRRKSEQKAAQAMLDKLLELSSQNVSG